MLPTYQPPLGGAFGPVAYPAAPGFFGLNLPAPEQVASPAGAGGPRLVGAAYAAEPWVIPGPVGQAPFYPV